MFFQSLLFLEFRASVFGPSPNSESLTCSSSRLLMFPSLLFILLLYSSSLFILLCSFSFLAYFFLLFLFSGLAPRLRQTCVDADAWGTSHVWYGQHVVFHGQPHQLHPKSCTLRFEVTSFDGCDYSSTGPRVLHDKMTRSHSHSVCKMCQVCFMLVACQVNSGHIAKPPNQEKVSDLAGPLQEFLALVSLCFSIVLPPSLAFPLNIIQYPKPFFSEGNMYSA